MSKKETSVYETPLTKREVIAKRASMGATRTHGSKPKKVRKPMVKDRTPVIDPEGSTKSLKRIGVGIGASLLAITALSMVSSTESEGIDEPTVTTVVGARPDGVWGAAERELADSGYADKEGNVPKSLTRDLTDEAVKLNERLDPNFNPGNLALNQSIVLPDVPHKDLEN